jgi:hypothetical protein
MGLRRGTVVRRLVAGAASGVAATVAMSGWMLVVAPRGRRMEQPPEHIVRRAAQRLGVRARPADRRLVPVAALAHLAFGTAGGLGYTTLVRRPALRTGIPYALGIWATSYLGWAPGLRLMPPPHRDEPRRQLLTFGAHLVYGAALAWVAARAVPDSARTGGTADSPANRGSGATESRSGSHSVSPHSSSSQSSGGGSSSSGVQSSTD